MAGRTAALRAHFARGRSSGAFSGMAGCTPSTASQCGTTPTSIGTFGSGASMTCAHEGVRVSVQGCYSFLSKNVLYRIWLTQQCVRQDGQLHATPPPVLQARPPQVAPGARL